MDKKKATTSEKHVDLKKQLEAIAGREIDEATAQAKILAVPVGAYSFSEGSVSWRNIIRFPSKFCVDGQRLLDVTGVSSTGNTGKIVFHLSNFVCFGSLNSLSDPVNVLATPRGGAPFFVTVDHTLIKATVDDVEITVYAWDPNGNPASGVVFDWRCRVVSNIIIL